jgi:hypothetical protein
MSSLTRGPLPPRVYWRRRVLLVALAVVLVFVLARLLNAGSDATSAPDAATPVAGVPTSTPTPSATATTPPRTDGRQPKKKKRSEPVLAAPTGSCADADIAVTPTVPKAVAGREVFLVLKLRTIQAEACTWEVSPETLTLKITSGNDDIWASRQCPRAVPTRSVVVRRAVSTSIGVTWNARRSDDECSRLTHWALPGYYHLDAAALAGEPAEVQFELETPPRVVITRSPSPKQEPRNDQPAEQSDEQPDEQPQQGKKTPVARR